MAFTYGFYNSVNHDRVYDNEQLSSIFNGIMLDGVIKKGLNNDQFKVIPNGGMKISVGRGMAWFNNTWNRNDSALSLTIDKADASYDRYDAVILEIDAGIDRRINSIKILKGMVSSSPAKPSLTRTKGFNQYALAYILIPANTTKIVQSNIQNAVGTNETPWCRSIADDIETKIANSLDITEPSFVLDARQGRVLDQTKADKVSVVNNHATIEEGYILDARQGKALDSQSLISKDHIAWNSTTTVAGYVLDAREGKALNNLPDMDQRLINLVEKSNVVNNVITTDYGYVLDARQGKALNDTLQTKLNTDHVVNHFSGGAVYFENLPDATDATRGLVYYIIDQFETNNKFVEGSGIKCNAGTSVEVVKITTSTPVTYKYKIYPWNIRESGFALDARLGKTLLENKADIIDAVDARIGLNLQGRHNNSNIPFRFGINGGNYGYYIGNTFTPFIPHGYTDIKNLGKITRYNVSNDYPDLYQFFTNDNFYIKVKEITFEGGISEFVEDWDNGREEGSGTYMAGAKAYFNPNLDFIPSISYDHFSGVLAISDLKKSGNISYVFADTTMDREYFPPEDVIMQGNSTVSITISDYEVYMIPKIYATY